MATPADSLPLREEGGLDLLDGVVVLDLTTSIAGPYAGQLLGDLGATVIKVERPVTGDDCRAWGPPFLDGESLWFLSVNRNKRGATLDIAGPQGHDLLLRMVAKADVVLVNLVARAQRKLGVDEATLRLVKPDLIHVSITGFGLAGERADMPCYDLIAEGYSGVMAMTGEVDGPPQKVGTPAADLLAGEDAALATLAAYIRRQRTGRGATVDISLVESMTRFMGPRLTPYLGSGERMSRSGGRDSVIAVYQSFETADEPLTLGLGTDGIWRRFWSAIGEPERADLADHASNVLRRQDRATIVAIIAERLRCRGRDEWLRIFAEASVPAGPIYRLDEIGSDSALRDRGFIYAVERGGVRMPQVGLGIGIDGRTEGCRPPPKLGADNDAIFREWLNLGDDALRTFAADGVI